MPYCGFNAQPNITVTKTAPATALVDGDNGMGQWVAMRAMQMAIYKAQSGICAFVSVRNSNHFGAAGYYARMAVPHDMIGFSFTTGGINHMTPWGGARAVLGNNPFAIALPAGQERPVVLDMACSTAARGKILVAAQAHGSGAAEMLARAEKILHEAGAEPIPLDKLGLTPYNLETLASVNFRF